MSDIFVIIQHTGSYSDYRAYNVCYVKTEAKAVRYCELAKAEADMLHEKLEKLQESEPEEYDEKWYKRFEKKKAKLKSKYDEGLDSYEFNDVTYTFAVVEKANF